MRALTTSACEARAASPQTELLSLFRAHSFEQRFQPDSTIALHGEAVEATYRVVSGTVRCCTIDACGFRQIFRFATKGDFIGISDVAAWHFTAEAVDHVILRAVPREIVARELKASFALREEVWDQMCQMLECREQQLLSLVSKKAPERLLEFLRAFAASRSARNERPVALPMCRRDIADHLGMSVETVSRTFTDLRLKGHIDLVTCEKFRILGGAGFPALEHAQAA